jgi:hypothetical protein
MPETGAESFKMLELEPEKYQPVAIMFKSIYFLLTNKF